MSNGPGKARFQRKFSQLDWLVVSSILILYLVTPGCTSASSTLIQNPQTAPIINGTVALTKLDITPTSNVISTVNGTNGIQNTLPVWLTFAPPIITPATAVPPPMTGLDLPDEVQVALLVGLDQDPPYVGRSMVISLLIFNPRYAKASLLTISPDLFVYIPGYTMQRISVAYSIGGLDMLSQTIQYNFGLRPNHWVLAHPSDFIKLVDDLGGLDVPVFVSLPGICAGITAGVVHMNGTSAWCYINNRQSIMDFDAEQRQQLFMRLIFLRMVDGGNLVQLPKLYNEFESTVITDLTLDELISYIPLALKLGDPQRISYFQLGSDDVIPWQISGNTGPAVLLLQLQAVQVLVQQAIDDVLTPAPLTDRYSTLVYELTVSPTPTLSLTPTLTPIPSITKTKTATITQTKTSTITITPTTTITPTQSPSMTLTPVPSATCTIQ